MTNPPTTKPVKNVFGVKTVSAQNVAQKVGVKKTAVKTTVKKTAKTDPKLLTMKLEADFYDVFDRLGEGVMFHYEVRYDFDHILTHNFTRKNFVMVPIGIGRSDEMYLSRNQISKTAWEREMAARLKQNNYELAKENFFEQLTDLQNDQYLAAWVE